MRQIQIIELECGLRSTTTRNQADQAQCNTDHGLGAIQTIGRTYRWLLRNTTQHLHPIHIHGHTFTVLGSDKRTLPPHHADTVLLMEEETVEVAFVADNPGRWMLHCHVAEHQETGMMAYFTVT